MNFNLTTMLKAATLIVFGAFAFVTILTLLMWWGMWLGGKLGL